jgi:hypothetical protein
MTHRIGASSSRVPALSDQSDVTALDDGEASVVDVPLRLAAWLAAVSAERAKTIGRETEEHPDQAGPSTSRLLH